MNEAIEPKYIKPDALIEYEQSDDKFNKILERK